MAAGLHAAGRLGWNTLLAKTFGLKPVIPSQDLARMYRQRRGGGGIGRLRGQQVPAYKVLGGH